jgi:hypothetical protein
MGGAGANLPEDALYPMAFVDSDEKPLDGRSRYVLHFETAVVAPLMRRSCPWRLIAK